MMKNKSLNLKSCNFFIISLLLASCGTPRKTGQIPHDIYSGVEFTMPEVQLPKIPGYSVILTDFGAVSGGQVLNTDAFARAIEAVTAKGGGKITIPAGIWLTGPIILKSNLEMHLAPGAMVIFSSNKDLYPLVETSFEGLNTWRCMSPLYGKNLENIAFTGEGVWDGSGDAWRFVKKSKLTDEQWKKLVASGGVTNDKKTEWYPSEQFRQAHAKADTNVPAGLTTKEDFEKIRDFLRPVMVSLINCKKVMFDGPAFQNSPAWCIHPLMVENLIVRNITVKNPWYSQNGDGIDIESCKNVLLYNSNFDVGDDAICIKSGKDKAGRDRGIPSENIVIKNCVVYHGHGGVTIGSEMSGGVRNMQVSNCTFIGTDVGIRFKSNRGRGGVVENIFIRGIQMANIPTQAISFDLYYGGRSVSEMLDEGGQAIDNEEKPVTEETPVFRNISMSDITCKGAYQAIFLQGLPEMNLQNITFKRILMEADFGLTCINADGVRINGISLITKKLPTIVFTNSKNVSVENLHLPESGGPYIEVDGSRTKSILLKESQGKDLGKLIRIGSAVKNGEVRF
jgi:polygalacturonase